MIMPDTAIVPCGGLGTRMQPISRWLPKELLPVSLVPLIHWTLAEAAEAGLRRAVVVINPSKPILGEVARGFERPGFSVELVSQDRPAGLGDALLRARAAVGEHPFAVLLPDNLFRGPNQTAAVLEAWERLALATVLIAEIRAAEAGSKGATGRALIRETADGLLRVTALADKGRGRFDAGPEGRAATPIGRFVLPTDAWTELDEIARVLEPGAELDDVPLLQRLADRNALVGVPCGAEFFDVGVPEGYCAAVAAFPAAGVSAPR
jgi:UTP--glucose-1-phosphate uridylyltransferase